MISQNAGGSVLNTCRLILEPLNPDHAKEMVPVLEHPGLYEFTGGHPPTLEALSHRYVLQSGGDPSGSETWLNWIIREQETGSAAGFVQATVAAGGHAADVAWVVGQKHQGRGYATEAASAMVDWLIQQGVGRFYASIHSRNASSAAVAAHLGMARTGRMDSDGEEIWQLDPGNGTMATTVDASAVDQILQAAAAREEFSGTIRVSCGGSVLHEGAHGVASRRWDVPVSLDTRFDVASVTKLFTSVAVLQQVDAGTLALDFPIGRFVDLEGTRVDPGITLGQLLSHTSGIGDDADEEAGESYEDLWTDRPTYSVTKTADFLPQFVYREPNFAPGTGCRYCNCGYILAGLALEAVTGMTYRDYVREYVFAAAGMRDSGFFSMREAVPNVAEGWDPVRDDTGAVISWRQNIFSYPPVGSPDGGAHSTSGDLVRFLDAVRGGRLLSAGSTAAFLAPQAKHSDRGGGELHYGYGLEFQLDARGQVGLMYKEGINAGASAFLSYFPESDITMALVANSEDGVWGPLKDIRALLQGN
ncbi:GNAT family N-acetyltransferase [Arthrobacter citreus]|uniref:GNAT family N-acetyltransferase n=1 Tax=Arthrobacter TaxID=1663 RepID=UPI001264C223|nr:GNAT family N-acetyltransferase [Arthrobacter gandavensis]